MRLIDRFKVYGYNLNNRKLSLDFKRVYHLLYKSNIKNEHSLECVSYDPLYLRSDAVNFFDRINLNLHEISYVDLCNVSLNGRDRVVIDNLIEKITPFDLPIYYVNGNAFSGSLCKYIVKDKMKNLNSVVFLGFKLSKQFNKMVFPCYVHEIVHTQVDSIFGAVENYYNSELLSIFMEKLATAETGDLHFLRAVEKVRFYHVLECLSSLLIDKNMTLDDYVEFRTYVFSALQAEKLFDLYVSGGDVIKRNIILDVQNIFDNICTLEDVLDRNNVTIENSMDVNMIKRHLTY